MMVILVIDDAWLPWLTGRPALYEFLIVWDASGMTQPHVANASFGLS